MAVDGKTLIDWKGSPAELKLIPGYRMPDDRSPFIGCWETSFLIHELWPVPVGETARPLR